LTAKLEATEKALAEERPAWHVTYQTLAEEKTAQQTTDQALAVEKTAQQWLIRLSGLPRRQALL
jgi:hypothetical protein